LDRCHLVEGGFAQNNANAASQQWRHVSGRIRPKVPKLATVMDEAETDVLAYMSFPTPALAKKRSTSLPGGKVRLLVSPELAAGSSVKARV
jgi:putative transposase